MISPRTILSLQSISAFALAALLVFTSVHICFAQGGSPVQAEYTGQPVPAGPNVNEFTGDFTYGLPVLTVPGPHGSSYSLTLSYQAGTNPNSDVSWVGYGWSLNPGAVVRGERGFPDDWDGEVIYHAKRPLDYTVSAESSITAEVSSGALFGLPFLDKLNLHPGIEFTKRYDSRTGFGNIFGASAGVSMLGNYAGGQFMNENGEHSWSGILSPNLLMTLSHVMNSSSEKSSDVEATPKGLSIKPFSFSALWEGSRRHFQEKITSRAGMPFVFSSREYEMPAPASLEINGTSRNIGTALGISLVPGVVAGGKLGTMQNILTVQPTPRQPRHAYGYMRSGEATDDGLMDYYYEKDVPYILDDKFLPIPFSNADVFSVTGGGNFRLYNRNAGGFHSNALSSIIEVTNAESTLNVGAGIGIGVRFGLGQILYDTRSWDNPNAPPYSSFTDEGDEPWFFRFTHDMGGSLLYDNDDRPVRAGIIDTIGYSGEEIGTRRINVFDRIPVFPADIRLHQEAWERPGRSGYVGFTLNKNMLLKKSDKYYKSYARGSEVTSYVTDRHAMPDQIGEFALFGPGNSRYVYGLPVYARDQRSMSLGLRNMRLDSAANIKHHLLAHRYLDEVTAPTAIGEELTSPHAVAWLLTQITTPDYVDLTGNGPSDDDLGGWTRFHYVRGSGSTKKNGSPTSSWTYWRTPYNGLAYNPGALSDPEDDLGSYSEGWKETYYPWMIETKTHIAWFRLNDVYTPRKDAYAQRDDLGRARLAGDSTLSGARYNPVSGNPERNDSRYLERIELYTKGADGNPDSLLSTVHFEYDYSLRPNMPNSLPLSTVSTTRHGMLTLRKVWTESLNVRNNRIAPVLFGYEYRKSEDYAENVQVRYPEITGFADGLEEEAENPTYSPYDFDAWGNYRPGGVARLDMRFPYVPQNDTTTWDPAAWQLKWIKSPTGGELQVQYEEDDYAFVHDRPAMGMMSLVETVSDDEFSGQSMDESGLNKYFLRLSDFGIDSTEYWQVAQLRERIERYGKQEKKVFFKFFYALKGNDTDFENPEYSSDYIEGYADLDTVVLQTMDGGAWYTIYVKLIGWQQDNPTIPHDHGLPKKVCLDFVHKNKRGKLGPNEGVPYSNDRSEMMATLGERYYEFTEGNHCKDLDYARSYIRVPMTTSKKGGGLRVKRLLSYDPGIEGDSALYGTEYHYEVYDQERNQVISSGVAANEPGTARDENPLVGYNAREEDEKTYGKAMAGRDRARNEGPIGETLLPGASVGYSRVATNPIHQGATTVGFGVTDFHTYRDYPFDAGYEATGNAIDYTDMGGDDYRTPFLFSNFIFFSQNENLLYRTQGYRFVLTDMHGKVRRRFSNGGAYTPLESDWVTGAMTQYHYYQPGDSIPLLYRVGDSIRYGYPGKVMEVVHASRKSGSYIDDFKVEGDAGIWFASGMPYYAINNSELSTHVTSKVVNYPAIIRGVTSYADGNYNYVENVAFDPRSGAPLVTRARDAFDGLDLDQSSDHVGTYIGYSFPIVNVHPEFDQASGNERARIQSSEGFEILKKKDGSGTPYLIFPAGNEVRWLKKLTPGDFIELRAADDDADAGRYHVDFIDENTVWLLPSKWFNATSDPSLNLVDEAVNIEIVHSGRQNAPGASMGGVATYGETDAEVASGANFGWTGPGASARLAFVAQLNAALALGSGTFDGTNVDTSLYFKLHSTGSCGNLDVLGETFSLIGNDDVVFVSSPVYTDTLVTLEQGGWFALNDAGQIVFRSVGNLPSLHRWRSQPGEEQRVWNFTFCGDDPIYRSVAGVIGASASGRMNDTNDYDGEGLTAGVGEANAYETGKRGRWMPRTAYAYKTGVTDASDPVAGERVYKDAGVFDDFTLFNWSEQESSDMSRWFRLDTVTHITQHNVPYSGEDMLGHPSVTLFSYGESEDLLPVLTAWNAEEGSVAFESFEIYDDGAWSGDIADDHAHAGNLSLTAEANAFAIALTATEQVLEKGLLVRFWMYPLWRDEVDIQLTTSGSPALFSVTGSHRIARAGEWALYEYHLDSASLAPLYSVDDVFTLNFQKADAGDTIRIDDVKIQPANSVAAGYVFDKRTFRPVAMFDDQNFGAYPQYDAEGKGVRTIVETSRGVRTVAESHVHIPGADRDWLGEGEPFTPSTILSSGTPSSLFESATDPMSDKKEGTSFDALNIELGLDRRSVKVFGVDPRKLRDMVQEKVGEFNALTGKEVELLDRYEELTKQHAALQQLKAEASTEEAKREIEEELQSLESERDALLKQLGITSR